LICGAAEHIDDIIHPFQFDPPESKRTLAGRVGSIFSTAMVSLVMLVALPTVITPFRYVCALIRPKSIAPLWGFPYPCRCPSCQVPHSEDVYVLPARNLSKILLDKECLSH
jgi:hypothetical protein